MAERRDKTVRELLAAVELAHAVRAPRINMLAGRLLPGIPRARQIAEAASTLRECASVAAAAGLTIVVEQVNEIDVPGYVVPTAAAVAHLIEAVDSEHVKMLYDAYHAARAGADPLEEAPAYADLIGHVHYADCPGRGAPGTGRVSLVGFVHALADAGYDGLVGLEYEPKGSTSASLGFLS